MATPDRELTPQAGSGGSDRHGANRHEIERVVRRLNEWFAEHRQRIPPSFNWRRFRRERWFPVFKAVPTTAIKDWKAAEVHRLFRVARPEGEPAEAVVQIPIELLVTDRSVHGKYLDAPALLDAVLQVFASRHLLGRFNPRLWWFWLHYPPFIQELETYVQGIRLRVDAATPVRHDQRRVFEEFSVPLVNGQQTAIGSGCFFVLEQVQPYAAAPYWRYSITRDGEIIVGPLVLQAKPIYHQETLLAVIKKIDDQAVTLSVLTSEGG
jgi:hypothetical protein